MLCFGQDTLQCNNQKAIFVLDSINNGVISQLPVPSERTGRDTLVGIFAVVSTSATGRYGQDITLSDDFDIFTTPPSQGNL